MRGIKRDACRALKRHDVLAFVSLCGVITASLFSPHESMSQATTDAVSLHDLLRAHLPKDELQVAEFIAQRPDADGSGVLVAVLDSGVDLDQDGLRHASNGSPKIIDFYDATDDGLVEMPREVIPAGDSLLGYSGRCLHLGAHGNHAQSVRVGGLIIEDFFPRRVRERLQKRADEAGTDALALLQGTKTRGDTRFSDQWKRELESDHPSITWLDLVTIALPIAVFDELVDSLSGSPPGSYSEDRRDLLSSGDFTPRQFQRQYSEDTSDQNVCWGLLIDTDGDGNLGEERLLLDYRVRYDVARLSDPAHIAVGANIAPAGDRVSLLYDEGGHGTHVAGIVGAFYGESDPFNGIAPGAQILAVKIGNGKFGGATSHNSIMKGIDYAIRAGADVVNISFGGSSFLSSGRELVCEFINEAVDATGIIVCSSAGNAGPALSTVGSPASARSVFAIGASLAPATMETNYGVVQPRRMDLFGFSSRGPLLGGDLGVDFIAPGAAFSTLPSWHLAQAESWNGTSMASPEASGCIALLISAALRDSIPHNAVRMRRALRLGAKPLPHLLPFEQGAGLIQVADAYDCLKDLASEQVVEFEITGTGPFGEGGGYYTRFEHHDRPFRLSFRVKPRFPEKTPGETKAAFKSTVDLVGTAEWLSVARQVAISAHGVTIGVTVDPRLLSEGLNVGAVLAFPAGSMKAPSAQSARGAARFEIPFTIVRPLRATGTGSAVSEEITLEPGDRVSTFILVPQGATRARLRVTERLAETPNAYSIALRYLSVGDPKGSKDARRRVRLARGDEQNMFMDVLEGRVLEVAFFSRWQENGTGTFRWDLSFDGIRVDERHVELAAQHPVGALSLSSTLENTELTFGGKLNTVEQVMPFRWTVRPDTTYGIPPLGHPPLIALGRGIIDVEEEGTDFVVQWGFPPEFDDFLDDAIWCIRSQFGEILKRGYIARGDAEFSLKDPGRYELQATVFAPALRWVDPFIGVVPRLSRKIPEIPLQFYDGVLGAHLDDKDRQITSHRLHRSWARRFGLRPKELPGEDASHLGIIEIRGHGSEGVDGTTSEAPPLRSIPLELRSVTPADSGVGCRERVWYLLSEAERALSAGAFNEALEAIAFIDRKVSRVGDDSDSQTKRCFNDRDALRFARVQLWHASRPAATEEELDRAHSLVQELIVAAERKPHDDDPERHALIAETGSSVAQDTDLWASRLFVRQALVAAENQDARAARTYLKKAASVVSEFGESLGNAAESKELLRILEAEYSLAVWATARCEHDAENHGGTDSEFADGAYDAVKKARDLLDRSSALYMPFIPWLQESLIRALLDLGWTDLATLELDRWMKRAPGFRSKQYQLRREIAAVRPSEATLRWAALRSLNRLLAE